MAIDLNDPSTYQVVDYGGGNVLYRDISTGLSYDPNDPGNPLSTSDVQSYGAPAGGGGAISVVSGSAPSQSSYNSPSMNPTVNSGSSGGVNLSGLTSMFTAIGSAFATKINPPKNTPSGQPLVYDAVRGTYIPASAAGQSVTSLSNIPMFVIIGLVAVAAIVIFKK